MPLDNQIKMVELILSQGGEVFSNLISWFIFYCTLHATAFISGYLSFLNIKKGSIDDNNGKRLHLLKVGIGILLFSCFISVVVCGIAIYFFYDKSKEIEKLVNTINKANNINLPSPGFWHFIYITIAMVLICAYLAWAWWGIRKKNFVDKT